MKEDTLTKWCIIFNEYRAPELRLHSVGGMSLKHGKKLQSSPIVKVIDERTVITKSGTIYHLEGPAGEMENDNCHPDGLDDAERCNKLRDCGEPSYTGEKI